MTVQKRLRQRKGSMGQGALRLIRQKYLSRIWRWSIYSQKTILEYVPRMKRTVKELSFQKQATNLHQSSYRIFLITYFHQRLPRTLSLIVWRQQQVKGTSPAIRLKHNMMLIQQAIRHYFYFIIKLMEHTQQTEDVLLNIFEEGVDQFTNYQKKIGESYKSRQQKNKERYEKVTQFLRDEQLKKEKRKQRKDIERKKLHEVIDKMTQAQARAYLDSKKALKKEKKQKLKQAMATGQMIILDLVYEGKMNNKENKSLGSQIELILKAIRYVENPPSVHLCNFKGGIKSILQKMRYEHWAITPHEEDLSIFGKTLNKRLIYLSPDAPEALQTVEEDDVFILGGLIDRTILKNASLARANQLGIEARRLPINEFMIGRNCLNLDHVVSMICKFKQTRDWKVAFDFSAPKRWKREQKHKANQPEEDQQNTSEKDLNNNQTKTQQKKQGVLNNEEG